MTTTMRTEETRYWQTSAVRSIRCYDRIVVVVVMMVVVVVVVVVRVLVVVVMKVLVVDKNNSCGPNLFLHYTRD